MQILKKTGISIAVLMIAFAVAFTSLPICAFAATAAPKPVKGFKASSSYNEVLLTWDKNADADSYIIAKDTSSKGSFSWTKKVTGTSYRDRVPDIYSKVYYRIYAVKDGVRSDAYASCAGEAVRPIQYSMKIKKTTTLKSIDSAHKKVKFKTGTKIIADQYQAGKEIFYFTYDGHRYKIKKNLTKGHRAIACRANQPYTNAEAEDYVNRRGLTSRSSTLVFVSTYTQHEYIMKGSKGNWKVEKDFMISTGKPSRPTPTGTDKVKAHKPKIHGVKYWLRLTHYSVHGKKSSWKMGYPSSNGCVRNTNAHAEWIYNNVPNKSTVCIY